MLQIVPYQFFDILQQIGCSKNPNGSPFYIFRHHETSKTFRKKIGNIVSSIFSFLRAFVVSSCRKSDFRVLMSLRHGADLGRSRHVNFLRILIRSSLVG